MYAHTCLHFQAFTQTYVHRATNMYTYKLRLWNVNLPNPLLMIFKNFSWVRYTKWDLRKLHWLSFLSKTVISVMSVRAPVLGEDLHWERGVNFTVCRVDGRVGHCPHLEHSQSHKPSYLGPYTLLTSSPTLAHTVYIYIFISHTTSDIQLLNLTHWGSQNKCLLMPWWWKGV